MHGDLGLGTCPLFLCRLGNVHFQKYYDILACWRRTRTKSGKYGPRALWSKFYMSLGSLYVPREVDLADKTRGAQRPESCPPGQPPEGHIGSLGTYRIVTRVPAGRILSTGRALWARPVRQGFCPRPPPAGQYVLYTPLTVYRISGMLYLTTRIPNSSSSSSVLLVTKNACAMDPGFPFASRHRERLLSDSCVA